MTSKGLAGYLFLAAVHLLPASAIAASAVAVDQAARKLGYCHSKPTLEEAGQCAVSKCIKSGGRDCQVTATGVKGGYSAIAAGNGQLSIFLSSNADEEMVSFYALNDCIQKVTDCNSMVEKCPETACRIIAKWHEPETPEPAQSSNRQPYRAPASAQSGNARNGNAVEPLSNGLLLTMERNEVRQKFGDAPRRGGFPSCDMAYGNFRVDMCYGPHISRLYISGRGLTLNSGIGVGSSKADVARVFGNPYGLTSGQYKLDFAYDGERVSSIKIEPAEGDFKPYAASSAPTPAPESGNASAVGGNSDVVGTWHGTARTVGTIVIRADGTYSYNGNPGGRWKASGNQIVFDGSLAAWGGGRATLKGGNLEFSWKSAEGWKQWFSFAR